MSRATTLLAVAALLIAVAVSASAQTRVGDFNVVKTADPIYDTDASFIATTALNATALRTGQLVWGCQADVLYAGVMADEFLNTSSVTVVWRFDRKPPSEPATWIPGPTGTAVLVPSGTLLDFTDQATAGRTVVVRVTDYRGVQFDYEFSLRGATAALSQLGCYAIAVRRHAEAKAAEAEAKAAREEAERQWRLAARDPKRLFKIGDEDSLVVGVGFGRRPLGLDCTVRRRGRQCTATVEFLDTPLFITATDRQDSIAEAKLQAVVRDSATVEQLRAIFEGLWGPPMYPAISVARGEIAGEQCNAADRCRAAQWVTPPIAAEFLVIHRNGNDPRTIVVVRLQWTPLVEPRYRIAPPDEGAERPIRTR